jgi:hypothetical protein
MIKYTHKAMLGGILKMVFAIVYVQGFLMAEDCLTKSYRAAIGTTQTNIEQTREDDLQYNFTDLSCCCTKQINALFQKKTESMTHRVNPAVDRLIEALQNQRKASDIKIEELVHLKYVNTMYSFFDKDPMKNEKLRMPDDTQNEDGCQDEIVFRKADETNRKGTYREGILKEILTMLHAWEKSEKMIVNKNMIKMFK